MGSELPYRIDLFDDEIETLRTFDPETQLTIQQVDSIQLLPAKEFPLDKNGIQLFRQQWHERFDVNSKDCPVYQDVNAGISPAGICHDQVSSKTAVCRAGFPRPGDGLERKR